MCSCTWSPRWSQTHRLLGCAPPLQYLHQLWDCWRLFTSPIDSFIVSSAKNNIFKMHQCVQLVSLWIYFQTIDGVLLGCDCFQVIDSLIVPASVLEKATNHLVLNFRIKFDEVEFCEKNRNLSPVTVCGHKLNVSLKFEKLSNSASSIWLRPLSIAHQRSSGRVCRSPDRYLDPLFWSCVFRIPDLNLIPAPSPTIIPSLIQSTIQNIVIYF